MLVNKVNKSFCCCRKSSKSRISCVGESSHPLRRTRRSGGGVCVLIQLHLRSWHAVQEIVQQCICSLSGNTIMIICCILLQLINCCLKMLQNIHTIKEKKCKVAILSTNVWCMHQLMDLFAFACVQGSQRELLNLSQQDYANRIEELNQSLKEAWSSDQKVKALKIVIQVREQLSRTFSLRILSSSPTPTRAMFSSAPSSCPTRPWSSSTPASLSSSPTSSTRSVRRRASDLSELWWKQDRFPNWFLLCFIGRLVFERIWTMCSDPRPLPGEKTVDRILRTLSTKWTFHCWFVLVRLLHSGRCERHG